MHRSFAVIPAFIGAAALLTAGSIVDLHAQRGRGAGVGHGRPATAGTPAQGRGGLDNPGAQGQPHRPTPPDAQATGPSRTGDRAKGIAGRPTVADQVTRNTNLATRLQGLFPAGADIQKEAAGFRNLGQFVAAAHVSRNLDIPWTDLKAKMTGNHAARLGQAIHELKPQADVKTETAKAEKQAERDIKDSSQTKTKTKTSSAS